MRSFFRTLVGVLSFAVLATVIPVAAQDYPSRPVTIVVGYTPGATSDLVARTIGERLNAAWGQSVIVDNRSGVGGNIAAAYVARAQPDGYTLMVGTDAMMTTNIYLYKNAPFDPVKDFAPVIYAGANIICLAVNTEFAQRALTNALPGREELATERVIVRLDRFDKRGLELEALKLPVAWLKRPLPRRVEALEVFVQRV